MSRQYAIVLKLPFNIVLMYNYRFKTIDKAQCKIDTEPERFLNFEVKDYKEVSGTIVKVPFKSYKKETQNASDIC